MREISHALPGNMNYLTVKSRNNMADGEPQKEKLIVETYIPADPGPYPQDKPKQNSVRFTPTQVLFRLSHNPIFQLVHVW
jgi:intron-binding protein aquarius